MKELIDLLRESRDLLRHLEDSLDASHSALKCPGCLMEDSIDAAIAKYEAEPERKPPIPQECRGCDWLDKHGPLVPQGRPFCEQFRFCPPVEAYRHFGCTKWEQKK